jgi:branched-subunit amino acid transport protein
MSWAAILLLGGGAYLFKLAGVIIGPRLTAPLMRRSIILIPAALFSALIALQTFERDTELVIDPRLVGLIVAVVATWRKAPFLVVIAAATAATALVRLIGG